MTVTLAPRPGRPLTISRQMPNLARDERRCLLANLASDCTLGVTPEPAVLSVVVQAFASGSLSPAQAMACWADYLGEVRRVQAIEAGEPEWRDLEPGLAHEDCAAALNDLLDGTNTYRGQRP
jgi:hypothetical protein